MADEKKNGSTEATGEGTGGKPKPPFDLGKLLVGVFLIVNMVVMFGATFVIYKVKVLDQRDLITEESLQPEMDADRKNRENADIRFTFEPFTANLDERPKKLINTTIQLEMLNEDGYVEIVEKTPKARDEIVKIINSKKISEIETFQGKLVLKDQIMTAMNKMLQKGTVKDVLFDSFVVQ